MTGKGKTFKDVWPHKCVKGGAEEGRKEVGKGERRRGQKPKQRSVNRASVEHQWSLNDCWFDSKHIHTHTHFFQFCYRTHIPC